MKYTIFEKAFNERIPTVEGYAKPSAVLIPLVEINNEPCMILTQRALHMKHQPGDFCFPGGRSEGNETAEETALRETWEELGILPERVKILGPCDFITTSFGAFIKPFVGVIENFNPKELNLNKDEVEKVIFIPLNFIMETEPRMSLVNLEPRFAPDFPFHLIVDGKNYAWGKYQTKQFFYDYNGDVIWGLTARIINNFKDILAS